ncbi:MAG: YicC/YloC family endoribonuclease [Pseudomonadota bacterium]
MTGYGSCSGVVGKGRISVEVKTLNHRYCDVNIKLSNSLSPLESHLRGWIRERVFRGRVDVFVRELRPVFGDPDLTVNKDLAQRYIKAIKKFRKELDLPPLDDPLEKANYDDFIIKEDNSGSLAPMLPQIKKLVDQTLLSVDGMRLKEGRYIIKEQKKHLKTLSAAVRKIRKTSMSKQKILYKKAANAKLAGESDRCEEFSRQDITEELERLMSHISQYTSLINLKEPVGRKLDFLLQEMNRELNTIGSKACEALISHLVVESKSELERLREQVQNLE